MEIETHNQQLPPDPALGLHGVRASIYILCAAIHFDDESVHPHQPKNIMSGFVISGRRHHNVFITLKCLGIDRLLIGDSIQGFITSDDRFVNRKEAAQIAFDAGQIKEMKNSLFSEDLY